METSFGAKAPSIHIPTDQTEMGILGTNEQLFKGYGVGGSGAQRRQKKSTKHFNETESAARKSRLNTNQNQSPVQKARTELEELNLGETKDSNRT